MNTITTPTVTFEKPRNSDEVLRSDLFFVGEDLVESPQHKIAASSPVGEINKLLPTGRALRMHEDLKEGCGGQLWPAGMVLSKYLLRQDRSMFDGRTIIELGAGGGLVGLALALAHQPISTVHITDQLPMLALMQHNIELNNLQDQVKASIYDWGAAVPEALPQHPDIILAADCVYFEPAFPLLQQTLRDLIGEKTVCYFCFKKRRRADLNFVKVIKKQFDVQDVLDDPDRATWSRESLFLYRITKKA